MHVNRPGLPGVLHVPDLSKELLPGEHHPGSGQEQPQQLELLIGQVHPPAVRRYGALPGIHPKAARLDDVLLFGGAAPEYGLHSRHHLRHAERLCNIVVRAHIKARDLVVFRTLCRGHDNRNPGGGGMGAEPFQDGQPVLPGQHDVQEDQLGRLAPNGLKQAAAVGKAPDLKPGGCKGIAHQPPYAVVVFHRVYHNAPLLRRSIVPHPFSLRKPGPGLSPLSRRISPTGQCSLHGRRCAPGTCLSSSGPGRIPPPRAPGLSA